MKPTPNHTRNVLLGLLVVVLLSSMCPSASATEPVADLYQQARDAYHAFLGIPVRERTDAGWQHCIGLLKGVMRVDRHHRFTDKCLYLIGQSYHHMYDASDLLKDRKAALKYYRRLVYGYPKSSLADDAQFCIGLLYVRNDPARAYIELTQVGRLFPHGDMRGRADLLALKLKKRFGYGSRPPIPNAGAAVSTQQLPSVSSRVPDEIKAIRYWSSDGYTRVVLYLRHAARFQPHTLPAVPILKVPLRIYLDIDHCVMNDNLPPLVTIADRQVQDVRVAQFTPTQTRVVLDINSMKDYRVRSVPHPFRLVIDVRGKQTRSWRSALQQFRGRGRGTSPSLAQQLGLAVHRIVIDPGHGGRDTGAIGPGNIYEKTITLDIAKKLKTILEAETNCQVILTRTRDHYLSLAKRTAIANADKADLFVSIHANANRDHYACGTETFFLNFAKDKESARVAAFENAASGKKMSNLENILKKLMLHSKLNESQRLAKDVQNNIIHELRPYYHCVRSLGVKQAPFEVLIGAKMPAILVETAFITNPREEHLLENHTFQERMAEGIASGIESYMHGMNRFAQVGGGS